jgi:hypothetical protein
MSTPTTIEQTNSVPHGLVAFTIDDDSSMKCAEINNNPNTNDSQLQCESETESIVTVADSGGLSPNTRETLAKMEAINR